MTAPDHKAVNEALQRIDFDCPSAALVIRDALAHCFKLAGADCDGGSDAAIAPRAVQAVADLRRDYDEACTELEKLRQRCGELEADARRYQWMRQAGEDGPFVPMLDGYSDWLTGEEFDAAIDYSIADSERVKPSAIDRAGGGERENGGG